MARQSDRAGGVGEAIPLRRHRSSLEGVIYPAPQRLAPEKHVEAIKVFDRLIQHFEPLQASNKDYKPMTLLRLMKEEVSSEDEFLVLFFNHIEHGELEVTEASLSKTLARLHSFQEWTSEERDALNQSLANFASYLVDNFFLPLKSLAAKTPQPTPASLSRLDLSGSAIGTPQRVSNLRKSCLTRDRHRCVVTRKFDIREAEMRYKIDGENVKDDDGKPLVEEAENTAYLEVAHIIPHSLMSHSDIEGESKLTERKQVAHKILKMFNPDAFYRIMGTDIDRQMNALTLTQDLHQSFGNFEIAFEPVQNQPPHTYKIDYVNSNRRFRTHALPVTRTLYVTPDRNIDPPSAQLLDLHRAIGRILHLSGAGERIDKFIRDMEDMEGGEVCSNGSTRIDDYVRYKLTAELHQMSVF
ncbi:hypothetical protein CBS147321_10996 [Aspergillus niger]|uniref:Aldo/keto reductase family protein n=1 Tax=Aspergillus niger TaxID=5061 RepID=A0A254U7Z6_ASPNG|nr:hypothetical protein CBS12448_10880 [Aspergillus niger]KAI2868280.1 hypothetical protein CBS11852_11370 [Aspergillus niger]KAI2928634.1 hypothetical protein CBS147321_10996 [Aspergillus niger]KAI2937277.1 hypothetical protein CBS147322_10905 [Aspergillus niger]KAI2989173.1 hypothetical protein CBS147345_10640 [Aspergillus niger]